MINMKNYTAIPYRHTSNYAFTKSFLNNVFIWMSIGLALTSLISFSIASSPSLMSLFADGAGMTELGYIVTFAPVAFVLIMSFGFNKLSYFSLLILFLIYAGITGASLSFIFLIYTSESIYSTFFIAAAMFGSMGLIGYLTKSDLTRVGNILLMGLIGIIIASLVNLFLHNDALSYVISIISVVIFCGLTAYDTQKLKTLSENTEIEIEEKNKLGILGALTLYLDFINIFLSLLRFFGKRKRDY
jgi:uncharacterized protein